MNGLVKYIQTWGIMFMFSIFAAAFYITFFINEMEMDTLVVLQCALITAGLTFIQMIIFNQENQSWLSSITRSVFFLLIVTAVFTTAAILFEWVDPTEWNQFKSLILLIIGIYLILWPIYFFIHVQEAKKLNQLLSDYKQRRGGNHDNS